MPLNNTLMFKTAYFANNLKYRTIKSHYLLFQHISNVVLQSFQSSDFPVGKQGFNKLNQSDTAWIEALRTCQPRFTIVWPICPQKILFKGEKLFLLICNSPNV